MRKDLLKLEYKENCYVLLSFGKRDNQSSELAVQTNMSFLYDAGDIAVEWEPQYGPIQTWYKCEKDHEDAKENYWFDYVLKSAYWSQMAVDRRELPKSAFRGDYDYIFAVLEEWAKDK